MIKSGYDVFHTQIYVFSITYQTLLNVKMSIFFLYLNLGFEVGFS